MKMDVDTEMEMEGKVEGLDGGHEPKHSTCLRWLQRAVDRELYIQQGSLKFSRSAAGNVCLLSCLLLACRQTDLQACCE